MDRSTRNLSIITLLVLAIFLGLNHVARRADLMGWGDVLFFLLLAVAIWFYDRVSRRGVDDSQASETVIEPLIYDHASAPIGIPDTIQLVAPNPGTVIHAAHPAPPAPAHVETVTAPPAPVVTPPPPAPAPVVEEKAAPAHIAPAPELELATPAPTSEPAVKEEPAAPVVEASTPAKAAKPAKSTSKAKAAAAPAQGDDLKVIEGIGPKMEKALNAAGITTFAQLAASSEEQINAAITAAGMRFAPSVPTWAAQASYAAKGDLAGLEAYQKTLVGGRKAK